MTETQKTIAEWSEETSSLKDNVSIATEALESATELLRWLRRDEYDRIACREAADVAITLYWLAERNRGDLNRVVREYGGATIPAYTNLQRATILTVSIASLLRYLAVDEKNVPWTILADVMVCLDDLMSRLGTQMAGEINARMAMHRHGVVGWAAA